jgi:hypothetical protein
MTFKIIEADKRLAEPRGAKILIVGPYGVGKTSLLRTVDPSTVLFLNIEAGDLAIQDVPVDTIDLPDWPAARDLAVRIGGPNSSYPPTSCYSEAHFRAVGGWLPNLSKYNTLFVDSLTALSRVAFRWAETQPEATSDRTGRKDLRGAYGLLGRDMITFLNQVQHTRPMNVIFVAVLEKVVDEFGHSTWGIQMEGAKTGRELPGIVDEVLVMDFLNFDDGTPPIRGFVCNSPNIWGYPCKDRSGRLETIEKPHLGKLLAKLTAPTAQENSDPEPETSTVAA